MLKDFNNKNVQRIVLEPKKDSLAELLKQWFDRIVIGQDKAKTALTQVLLNSLYSIVPKKGPLAVLFFYWPSWTGKTEMSHALATLTLGRPDRLTKIKCEHFQQAHDGSNLIGSPKGYIGSNEAGMLSEAIYQPALDAFKKQEASSMINRFPHFNIIVLDEIEKAHPNIHQLLLGMMDDGELVLNNGVTLDFSESIIIMTSNIGAREKRDIDSQPAMGFMDTDKVQAKEEVNKTSFKLFSPEFLWRIDERIEFDDLTKKDCKSIIDINLGRMNDCINYVNDKSGFTKLSLELSTSVYDYLIEKGFDKSKGARQLVRVFNSEINATFWRVIHDHETLFDYPHKKAKIVARMVKGVVKFVLDKSDVTDVIKKGFTFKK